MQPPPRLRPPVLVALGATALALALAASTVLAAVSKPAVIRDAKQDVTGALDLQRLKLSLGSDGTLRAAVTFVAKVTAADMLADAGPPGSVCLRIWTAKDADTHSTRPDRLACVTAATKDKLRATVLTQDGLALPKRSGSAAVSASKTDRSLVITIPPSALGSPDRIQYAVESTRPGCDRPSCVDTVPDAPATRRFTLK